MQITTTDGVSIHIRRQGAGPEPVLLIHGSFATSRWWMPATALLPPDAHPPPYRGDIKLVFASFLRHVILRQNWDSISRRNGLTLLTDNLHLNDRSADVVAELVGEFVD